MSPQLSPKGSRTSWRNLLDVSLTQPRPSSQASYQRSNSSPAAANHTSNGPKPDLPDRSNINRLDSGKVSGIIYNGKIGGLSNGARKGTIANFTNEKSLPAPAPPAPSVTSVAHNFTPSNSQMNSEQVSMVSLAERIRQRESQSQSQTQGRPPTAVEEMEDERADHSRLPFPFDIHSYQKGDALTFL